jgi:hypothetical protein
VKLVLWNTPSQQAKLICRKVFNTMYELCHRTLPGPCRKVTGSALSNESRKQKQLPVVLPVVQVLVQVKNCGIVQVSGQFALKRNFLSDPANTSTESTFYSVVAISTCYAMVPDYRFG